MVHRVVDGVPGGSEAALLAVWIIGDDVDAGNLGDFVHRDMIVGDGNTLLLGEATAIAHDLSRLPHLIDHVGGILHGHAFLIELRTLAAYHVEQDAKAVELCLSLRTLFCPVLRA